MAELDTLFKIDLQQRLQQPGEIAIELGCGQSKSEGRIGIDRVDLPAVDIVTDLERGLPFFPDESVDAVHAYHFLEHVENLQLLLQEIYRVCRPGARIVLRVPHFSNPYYYSDYTHRRFFGLYSFEYFAREQKRFKRKIPNFYSDFHFITQKLELVFYSQWPGRKFPRKAAQFIFNLNSWWQEFYEENFCYILPCSEIVVILRPDKSHV
ncbi:methyltransferase domain-containing protein [candidate division KSB1 bacterium]|nr:MAG: methyltransferase domain-containing protein [candidate division KSB1 bacterium]